MPFNDTHLLEQIEQAAAAEVNLQAQRAAALEHATANYPHDRWPALPLEAQRANWVEPYPHATHAVAPPPPPATYRVLALHEWLAVAKGAGKRSAILNIALSEREQDHAAKGSTAVHSRYWPAQDTPDTDQLHERRQTLAMQLLADALQSAPPDLLLLSRFLVPTLEEQSAHEPDFWISYHTLLARAAAFHVPIVSFQYASSGALVVQRLAGALDLTDELRAGYADISDQMLMSAVLPPGSRSAAFRFMPNSGWPALLLNWNFCYISTPKGGIALLSYPAWVQEQGGIDRVHAVISHQMKDGNVPAVLRQSMDASEPGHSEQEKLRQLLRRKGLLADKGYIEAIPV